MRTIKFRAWNGRGMTYLSDSTLLQIKDGKWGMFDSDGSDAIMWAEQDRTGNVLMQFTGLKDKNGKEIYEGDIVALSGEEKQRLYEVMWNADGQIGWFAHDYKYRMCGQYFHGSDQSWEIVGNIYENKELLTL